ncbi:acyclic terpene utilization AtuA family protein [Pacificimonas sp. ICDLI1SI03]
MGVERAIRIAGGSAYFADSALGVPQLLGAGNLDYLVFDYLAEASMGMLGRIREADPAKGYPDDFLTVHVGPHLHEIARQGIRVVANAGALDPLGLAKALEAKIAEEGLSLKVAAIGGDELLPLADTLRTEGVRDMFTGAPLPDRLLTCNAYLGGFPIAEALARGADIVVTGRIVDSAIVLGPLIHEFGWTRDQHDLLAAGTLAGHLLECSTQITGGTFTDWQEVDGWDRIGFPIGECHADGSVIITKPKETGGLVSVGTVSEQLLYEVSNPADYVVADVACDFSDVRIEGVGPDRVKVDGAKGRPPTPYLKVSATYDAGWRTTALTPIIGQSAGDKARRQADALIERGRALLRGSNMPDFTRTSAFVIGEEASFGANARVTGSREVVLKLCVDHPTMQGAGLFAREQASGITTMSVGTAINLATTVLPLTGIFACLIDRTRVTAKVTMGGESWDVADVAGKETTPHPTPDPAAPAAEEPMVEVELVDLAWARSGDKGSLFNVAVIARKPEYLPWIAAAMDEGAVSQWFAHCGSDGQPPRVERFYVPGLSALNFVLHDSLGGGILTGTGVDPAAKGMGQVLLPFPVPVPKSVADGLASRHQASGALK